MKRVYEVCETEAEAIKLVNHLMQPEIGYSAYRQGTTVYVDDGGLCGVRPLCNLNSSIVVSATEVRDYTPEPVIRNGKEMIKILKIKI